MARLLIILCFAICARAAEDDKTNALAQFSGALERLAGGAIHKIQELRTAIHEQPPDMPAILQIERNGR